MSCSGTLTLERSRPIDGARRLHNGLFIVESPQFPPSVRSIWCMSVPSARGTETTGTGKSGAAARRRAEGQSRWGTALTLLLLAQRTYNPGVVKAAVVAFMLCALTGCGEPVDGVIPGPRDPEERLSLRLSPYLPLLESLDRVTVQEVIGGDEPVVSGPEPASARTDVHRVVSSAVLGREQTIQLRDAITSPRSWRLQAPGVPSLAAPSRVLVIQAGERMLKLTLYQDDDLAAFSDGRVHHRVRLTLSDAGAASMAWIYAVPLLPK